MIDLLDRAARRIPAGLYALSRSQPVEYLPHPSPTSVTGLYVAQASTGSLELVLQAYGVLVQIGQSGPVSVVSLLAQLAGMSRGARRMFGRVRLEASRSETPALRTGQSEPGELMKTVRQAVKEGYDEIAWVYEDEVRRMRFEARRTPPN